VRPPTDPPYAVKHLVGLLLALSTIVPTFARGARRRSRANLKSRERSVPALHGVSRAFAIFGLAPVAALLGVVVDLSSLTSSR